MTCDLNQPLISIVVASYNGANTILQCIDSIFSQSFKRVELIIIDGGSTDGTLDLLRANLNKISYWISEPDNGVYSAWNKGIAQSSGEWICFLGVDDFLWSPEVLTRLVSVLVELPQSLRIAYGQIMLLDRKGVPLYPIGEPWEDVKDRFSQVMSVPHPGLMHRRTLFELHGKFDERFRIGGDYEFLLRELLHSNAAFVPNLITVGMRQGGLSSTPENALCTMREARRAQRLHGLRYPGFIWISAVVRIYVRLLMQRLFGRVVSGWLMDFSRKLCGLPPYWTKI